MIARRDKTTNKMKYLIYIKAHLELETEDSDGKTAAEIAKDKATDTLNSFTGLIVDEAKVADKPTGFFIN